jgi:hypothetical protein
MAQVTKVRLVDDLDGGEADESVSFTLDGKSLEIDLSNENAEKLRDILAPYIAAARRGDGQPVGRQKRMSEASTASPGAAGEIRAWAAANGFNVSARGRISAEVMDAYKNRSTDSSDSTTEKRGLPKVADPFKVSFV